MQKDTIIRLADAYVEQTKLKLSTVSSYAANDGKFFRNLKLTSDVTIGRANRIVQWFSDNWPADLEWPDDIPRPSPNRNVRSAS
ncbi:hypothetical protein [Sulfitobacter alexandrii]|uniref:hypothetical protein n=1 Tax=Sulfitobacter alexandrii TaxID=1917485 RepID=UPI000903DDF5|nr:hypothetical protein [Sulfitobacter alexandrii]